MSPHRHYCSQGTRLARIETSQAEHRAQHRVDQAKTVKMLADLASHINDNVSRLNEAIGKLEDAAALDATRSAQIKKLFAELRKISKKLGVK